MKKIGIVTLYHKNYNYGGQLQAWAMQKVFSTNGYEAELISFETNSRSYFFQRFKDLGVKKAFRSFKNKIHFKLLMRNPEFKKEFQRKIGRFDAFMDSIPHTKLYVQDTISQTNEAFDLFVCGSDQIWNPGWWNDILFLTFAQKEKFSYAASIARNHLTREELLYLSERTKDYLAISVRERQAKTLLENELSRSVELTLDPTLLVEKADWRQMADFPCTDEKYILFYMVGDSKGLKKRMYEQCKSMGYQVYSIGFSKNTYFASDVQYSDFVIKDAGPLQWLGWIAKAEYVFTDSFHGSVFSMIFGKEFWCFERDNPDDSLNENSRLYNFLSIAGLEDRLLEYDMSLHLKDNRNKIDFESVEQNLSVYRKHSHDFIQTCLKQVEKNA